MQVQVHYIQLYCEHLLEVHVDPPWGGEGKFGKWVNFCWVCAAGLSQPLLHYSLLCDQYYYRPHFSHFWANM